MKRPDNSPRGQSIGEMISTLVYICMGLWSLSAALALPEGSSAWRQIGLYICGGLSLLGSVRFIIDDLWNQFKGRKK
ncbi:MAG: hypothetical protein ACI9O0_000671 [Paracoccaceae bacterium]|jgi:hypothetical protein